MTTGTRSGTLQVFELPFASTRGSRMSSLPQVAKAIQTVVTDIPEELGRATGFLTRRSKLTPARFVQTLSCKP